MNYRKTIPLFIILTLFVYTSCIYAMGTPPPRKYIPLRVLVVKGAEKIILRIKGDYGMVGLESGKVLKEGRNLEERILSKEDIVSEGIKILPERSTRIYINGRQFRGNIDIVKNEDAKLLAVNHIDLEEYLYGVLYHEVSHRWPIEVLKAQAIVARTYALYQKFVSKNKYFDLVSDVYSQVYGGRTSETWRTTRAVNLTQGLILTYGGKIFPAYYHATCGGRTSDAGTIWNIDIPPLRGRECDFCRISPHYRWKKELTMDYISEKMREAGYDVDIVSIEALKRDGAGRVLEARLKGKNRDAELSGNKFRLLIGPNVIKSANFEIQTRGRYVTFYGKGWGHGVGMCQWGAFGMATEGWKAEDILDYYYPGAEIVRAE